MDDPDFTPLVLVDDPVLKLVFIGLLFVVMIMCIDAGMKR